ncbi:DUF6125 family protein [Chloroflexota bacterium]
MAGMEDYSGDFKPNVRYQDFSREAQARLLVEYARLGLALDGWWYSTIQERYSNAEAIECEKAVWDRGIPYQQQRIIKALNIQGNNVEACFKTLQMDPQFCIEIFDIEWELEVPDHGIYTVNRCRAMEIFEKQGEAEKMVHMCQLDRDAFIKIARFFNPDMKVKALKLPPRKGPDEIACRWEFEIGPKG